MFSTTPPASPRSARMRLVVLGMKRAARVLMTNVLLCILNNPAVSLCDEVNATPDGNMASELKSRSRRDTLSGYTFRARLARENTSGPGDQKITHEVVQIIPRR